MLFLQLLLTVNLGVAEDFKVLQCSFGTRTATVFADPGLEVTGDLMVVHTGAVHQSGNREDWASYQVKRIDLGENTYRVNGNSIIGLSYDRWVSGTAYSQPVSPETVTHIEVFGNAGSAVLYLWWDQWRRTGAALMDSHIVTTSTSGENQAIDGICTAL